jgi:hypothetical protein
MILADPVTVEPIFPNFRRKCFQPENQSFDHFFRRKLVKIAENVIHYIAPWCWFFESRLTTNRYYYF